MLTYKKKKWIFLRIENISKKFERLPFCPRIPPVVPIAEHVDTIGLHSQVVWSVKNKFVIKNLNKSIFIL